MPNLTPVYVIGHINPDTDAIAAALGYAWLLDVRDGVNAIAARAGMPNTQAAWVLERFGLPNPELLTDAAPTIERIARRVPPVMPVRPLREAWAMAASGRAATPVVDAHNMPVGLFTSAAMFSWLSERIEDKTDLGHVSVARMLETPVGQVIDRESPQFPTNMRVRDARSRVLREERDDFWAVHPDDGTYFGICRTSDVLNPPRIKLVLVDHNEKNQAVSSLDEADLIEVIDHHRLGNPFTAAPIPFVVDTVGSTCTLIAERMQVAGLTPPAEIAGAMLAGALSDTLVLRSPTTTARDRAAVATLAGWAGIDDVQVFGSEMLQAGAGLATRDPDEAVSSDLKVYNASGVQVGIAQIEVANLRELPGHLAPLQTALDDLALRRGFDVAIVMVTDVVRGDSRLLWTGETDRLRDLPYTRLDDGTLNAPGVVSRKKQLLPNVLALLER